MNVLIRFYREDSFPWTLDDFGVTVDRDTRNQDDPVISMQEWRMPAGIERRWVEGSQIRTS